MLSQPSQFKIQRLPEPTLTGFFFFLLWTCPDSACNLHKLWHSWSPAMGNSQAEPHAIKSHDLLFVLELWWLPKVSSWSWNLKNLTRQNCVFKGGLDWCTSKSYPIRESGCLWRTHPNVGIGKQSQVQGYQEAQWTWWTCGCAQWERECEEHKQGTKFTCVINDSRYALIHKWKLVL